MGSQYRILRNLIGKKINAICLKGFEHSPLPNPNNEFITHQKEIAFLIENERSFDENYILKGLMVDFKKHSNIYKFRIEKSNLLKPRQYGGWKLDPDYLSRFNLNFEIGTIHLREEIYGEENVAEIKDLDILPSNIVITDQSGIQSIVINCYEIPGEQTEIEMRIRFHLGQIGYENKVFYQNELRYINMFGLLV